MRKTTQNNRRPFSRSTAAGIVLLLVLAGWPPAAAAQMTQSDWSKVQAGVKPGVPITVLLYQDQVLRGNRLRSRAASSQLRKTPLCGFHRNCGR